MSAIKFMDLGRQTDDLMGQLEDLFHRVVGSSQFIGGSEVSEFEREFAQFCDVGSCVGVANGTDALEIAIEALGLERGSKVLVPANSFIASAEAVTRQGHSVTFVPFDEDTHVTSVDTLRPYMTSDVAAIVVVHLYGLPVDVTKIQNEFADIPFKIIEDCAQAHGARVHGRPVGGLGDVGCFSFYPGKNLGAFGDAGAITTNNESMGLLARRIANHGRLSKFDHDIVGRNSRLDNLQAGVLRLKLQCLPDWIKARRKNANTYVDKLSKLSQLTLPKVPVDVEHAFHHFVVSTPYRDKLREFLASEGVGTGIHYPRVIPNFPAYADHPYSGPDLGNSLLSLPVAEHLIESDIVFVSDLVQRFFEAES